MKFFVNSDCIGCGLCTSTCPEVFEMTDDNMARASKKDTDTLVEAAALQAQNDCPVSAIEMA